MSKDTTVESSVKESQEHLAQKYKSMGKEYDFHPRFVINKAERIVNEQKREIETLRKQSERYNQMKLGILALLGIFGLSNIGNGIDVGTTEVLFSFMLFILVSFLTVFSSVILRRHSLIFGHYAPGIGDLSAPHDELQEQLNEMGTVIIENRGKTAIDLADEIEKNHEKIRDLNRELSFSYVIIFIIFLTILIIQFPGLLTIL